MALYSCLRSRPSRGGASRNALPYGDLTPAISRPSRGGASRNTVLALRKGISFRRPSRGGASRNIQSGLGIGGFGVSPLPWGRE